MGNIPFWQESPPARGFFHYILHMNYLKLREVNGF